MSKTELKICLQTKKLFIALWYFVKNIIKDNNLFKKRKIAIKVRFLVNNKYTITIV